MEIYNKFVSLVHQLEMRARDVIKADEKDRYVRNVNTVSTV